MNHNTPFMIFKKTFSLQRIILFMFFLNFYFFCSAQKTDTAINSCAKAEQVEKIISDAISIGAPVYNSGFHLQCYRVYEWAGYKILYEYGSTCKEVEKILKTAIEKSHGDYSDLEKAWIMRAAFDKILGVPTQIGEPEKKAEPDRKG